MKKSVFSLLLLTVFFLSSCTVGESSKGKTDYEQTKKMIVDILKSDEGKKAIKDILGDEEMKQQLIMEQAIVIDTIENTLTSDKGMDFWKDAFKDPEFAAAIAKSMKKENEELLKGLMKDPEYQGMMMDILKDPALQKDLAQSLKSKEFREHLQVVVTETLDSPIYKVKIQEILLKAAEELKNGKSQEKQSSGKSQGDGGGEESGGSGTDQ